MQNKEKTIISIVTHNSKDIFLVLEDLKRQNLEHSDYTIKIFDNHSAKEYKEKLRQYDGLVEIIEGTENRGFGYGHNQNLLHTNVSKAIIFNPDVLVDLTTMDQLMELLKQHPECGAVFPKVLNEDGTTQYLVRDRLSVFDYILRFLPFSFIKKAFDKRLSRFECRGLSEKETSYIRMGSGCFMVINTAAFKKVKGFDERFFMYFEDNDLCRKFEQANYKLLYTPFCQITHLYGKGSHRNRKLFKIFISSMWKYFQKWGWQFF